MEKILGFDLNKIVRGNNVEDLTYIDRTNECGRIYLRNIYVAEEDGEVLGENERVQYCKGDLLISFEFYKYKSEGPCETIYRVVNTRTTDITNVIKGLINNETI